MSIDGREVKASGQQDLSESGTTEPPRTRPGPDLPGRLRASPTGRYTHGRVGDRRGHREERDRGGHRSAGPPGQLAAGQSGWSRCRGPRGEAGLVDRPAGQVLGVQRGERLPAAVPARSAGERDRQAAVLPVNVSVQDAVFGFTQNGAINLVYPDGRSRRFALDGSGRLDLPALPRGDYTITTVGAGPDMSARWPCPVTRSSSSTSTAGWTSESCARSSWSWLSDFRGWDGGDASARGTPALGQAAEDEDEDEDPELGSGDVRRRTGHLRGPGRPHDRRNPPHAAPCRDPRAHPYGRSGGGARLGRSRGRGGGGPPVDSPVSVASSATSSPACPDRPTPSRITRRFSPTSTSGTTRPPGTEPRSTTRRSAVTPATR